MYAFDYHRARSLEEALKLFATLDEATFLAGGHTLLPTMKNRLAAPENLIDISALPELSGIGMQGGVLRIGAAMTHHAVAASSLVAETIPALAALAGSIGDVQVRHVGTMGGSVANNDPAADYPAAVLSLGAEIETDRRRIPADDFFQGLYATALEEGELIVAIRFPVPETAGYGKYRNPASRYALAASFVSIRDGAVRVAVTGAGKNGVFRWEAAEQALMGHCSASRIADLRPESDALLSDMHADAAFRANLVNVVTRRAAEHLGGASIV
ncbi:FAD binding domain-containing protein [Thetidibacter halocola]|uniref:Xanthine dehydrogenase family protein subunit M n=1 Tax=Thetidibacter halocola TaxID=2827239 RepID=A0A8J7WFB5_9RHOB|nr:xanthine dehydrogenase family protein subunit M [Thetidibacter halocola]MBS0124331.1 xanthine dehydrogenase family protein subunit M [Thetidibacter halocola]